MNHRSLFLVLAASVVGCGSSGPGAMPTGVDADAMNGSGSGGTGGTAGEPGTGLGRLPGMPTDQPDAMSAAQPDGMASTDTMKPDAGAAPDRPAARLMISPSMLALMATVNQTSMAGSVTVTNIGDAATGQMRIAISGANMGDFSLVEDTCSNPLPSAPPNGSIEPGKSCSVKVTLKSAMAGMKAAILTASGGSAASVSAATTLSGVVSR